MAFISKRRAIKSANKWHENVNKTVGLVRPAPTVCSERIHVFPYAQLQAITKEYLGKKTRSQSEQDGLLIELINDHPCKEVAFAACAAHLSAFEAQRALYNYFRVNPNTLEGLEHYLQAFVAAAYCKPELGLSGDRTFAEALVPTVQQVVDGEITPWVAKALAVVWDTGMPSNGQLLERARSLTRKVFQRVESDLKSFKTQLSLGIGSRDLFEKALGYRDVLSTAVHLDDSITSCISCMRGWLSWMPSERLKSWSGLASGSVFGCLLELEGPDLRLDACNDATEWQSLIQRRQLLPFIESKGFKCGPGLLIGDSTELLNSFINMFLDCVLQSLKMKSSHILQFFITWHDLDEHTLRIWQASVSQLEPEFLALLLQNQSDRNDMDAIVTRALNTLATDVTNSLRTPLKYGIAQCVERAMKSLLSTLEVALNSSKEWIEPANRLWAFRNAVAAAGWLHRDLNPPLVATCNVQSPHRSLSTLSELQDAIVASESSTLDSCFQSYVRSFIINGGATSNETAEIPQFLHSTWLYFHRNDIRYISLQIASLENLDTMHRMRCMKKLQAASEETVQDLRNALGNAIQGNTLDIMSFIITVAAIQDSCGKDPCWPALFVCVTKDSAFQIDSKELISLGYSSYRQCIESLYNLVDKGMDRVESTHLWLEQLRPVESALTLLELNSDSLSTVQCIITEMQSETRKRYLKMLQCFMTQTDSARTEMLKELILSLTRENSAKISEAVIAISKIDAKGFIECQKLVKLCHTNKDLAAVRLAVRLQVSEQHYATESALANLADVLNLGLDNKKNPPGSTFQAGRKDYAKRVASLVARVQQLERSRMALNRTDPNGVKSMVEELGLEPVQSEISILVDDLPTRYASLVKEVSYNELELTFQLSSEMNATEQWAFNLKGPETLSVLLQLNERGKFDALCVHVYDGSNSITQHHKYYKGKAAPDRLSCGGRLTRLSYIVARNLWRTTHEQGQTSLKVICQGIQAVINQGALGCIVCSGSIGAQLHRATTCNNSSCRQTYLKSSLDLRLEDVRRDGRVVDLLLSSVFGAANINNLQLLPNWPPQLNDVAKLQILLNSLPTTAALGSAPDYQTGLKGCGQRAEVLLSWLCTSSRGFIVSATGQYKLPGIPNIHQFLVVDNPPEIEAAFAAHDHYQERHVLFHGTSIDRLYAIIAQGLKILSRTDLQKHGAVHGSGIYTARQTSTAMSYATVTQASLNYNGFYNSRTDFRDAKVLLGVEHAGNDTGASVRGHGIHVITDPTRLMLRYIFIVPPNVNVPDASKLVPGMQKTFQSLRASRTARPVVGDRVPGAWDDNW